MKRINLLPPEQRVKAARELGALYALFGLLLLIVLLGAIYVWQNGRISDKQSQVTALQGDVQQLETQAAALQPYETLQSQRASMADTAQQIYDSRVIWSSILQELSLVIPDTVQLTAISANVPPSMLAGGELSGGSSGAASTVDITFSGDAMSHTDVAEFMTRLGLLPQLENINLTSSTMTTVDNVELASFQVTVALRPFLVAPPLSTAATTPSSGTTP